MTAKGISKLYLVGLILLASHNLDNLLLYGFDPFPIIITLPYLVIALLWKKLPKVAIIIILGIFTGIEMNHTITGHLPALIENGLGRKTFSALLFDFGLLFWAATIILLIKGIVVGFLQRNEQTNRLSE
jgi:Na+/proline symporter